MATLDIKYLCNPTDGTPGPAFDAFEVDAMNAASKGDKRGYSVADTWLGIDEGGTDPTAPALPPGATAMAVEQRIRLRVSLIHSRVRVWLPRGDISHACH